MMVSIDLPGGPLSSSRRARKSAHPSLGGEYSLGEARRGLAPPWPPNLVSFTSKFTSIFTNITSKFANILESIACNLITAFVIFFHVIISHDHRFFFEVPRIEELQDSDSSPRREEVARRTPRDYGGFLLPFFYRARFRESTSTTRKRQARDRKSTRLNSSHT